jgi:hypothetical protein
MTCPFHGVKKVRLAPVQNRLKLHIYTFSLREMDSFLCIYWCQGLLAFKTPQTSLKEFHFNLSLAFQRHEQNHIKSASPVKVVFFITLYLPQHQGPTIFPACSFLSQMCTKHFHHSPRQSSGVSHIWELYGDDLEEKENITTQRSDRT